MTTSLLLATVSTLCPMPGTCAAQEPALAAEIRSADLSAHVHFLAADELRGRDTGSPELVRAAGYLAAVFEGAGLEPAGDAGTYLQAVPLMRAVREAPPELELVADGQAQACTFGRDFSLAGGAGAVAGLSVVVVEQAEDIPTEPDAQTALYLATSFASGRRWLRDAQRAQGEGFGAIVFRGSSSGRERPFEPGRGRLQPAAADEAETPPMVRVNGDWIARFDAGEIERVSIDTHARNERVETYNVIARIPGVGTPQRPELAEQAVVFTAHYDHIGTRSAPQDGAAGDEQEDQDLIYNGADDDASGTACVLELAHAFAAGPKPARTLLFMLVTGEERGLLGTRYYLEHPVVPIERTVANLNYEMIGRPDETSGGSGRMWLTGHERSNLFEAINALGIPISADLRPEQNFFARSDNYAFAVIGVVAQTFSTYNMHADYHTVRDEADTLDYEHMQACTLAAYDAARLITDGKIDPQWLEGMQPEPRGR